MNTSDGECAVSDNVLNLKNESGYIGQTSYSVTGPSEVIDTSNAGILERYKESFTKSFDLYIINNSVMVEHIDEDYLPIIITTTTPQHIKYNAGYFDIQTYDLVNYAPHEESSLILTASSNFALSNTHMKSIEAIENSWNMKTFTASDTSTSINYFMLSSRSLVASN